mmetsp:Transcript_104634/g.293225  ORF Transcript_104634/g.293225 Transcript_104634/m.293225 type:complete len:643 (+) Transcript_104634:91-2019(+)
MLGDDGQEVQLHQPKNDIDTRHKVVKFGVLYESYDPDEEKLYRYHHQRQDLRVSKGSIPIGFESYIPLNEGHNLYLETREGGLSEEGLLTGPAYRISWKFEREVLAAGDGDGWCTDLDDLWTRVLAQFENKNLLSAESLEYLDADPFVLFGIDDEVTQQALVKLQRFPSLRCEASIPTFEEWAAYLRVDPFDSEMKWLVQAFEETELPKPWTCYKGVGSIVCYIRSDTGQVTWKHPFYDYFRQLRDFCREVHNTGKPEEIMKVRVNRLLWTYEASRTETAPDQDPLVSPEYLSRLADIFGYDVKVHGCIVRNLKAQLRVFARSYRERQDVEFGDVINCAEMLQRDVEKYAEMQDHWLHKVKEEVQFDLNLLSNAELQCVNCGQIALSFCLECKDYLCLSCYDSLHTKGSRLHHAPFRLVPCALCVNKPAKLHCTFTDKSLCHKCYAMDHIKQLPPDGKENQPRRIDYLQQYQRYAEFAKERNQKAQASMVPPLELSQGRDDDEAYEAVLSTDWHPFYDTRGVKFYHNFVTGERMRQSPRQVPKTADPGAEPEEMDLSSTKNRFRKSATFGNMSSRSGRGRPSARSANIPPPSVGSKTQPLPLEGFDALETSPKARAMAASQPDMRALRPPFRRSQPNEAQAM